MASHFGDFYKMGMSVGLLGTEFKFKSTPPLL